MTDGRAQREALNAADRALTHLGRGRTDEALAAAQQAARLDQVGVFSRLPEVMEGLVAELYRDNEIQSESWDELAAAVGPGPLAAKVAGLRG